MASNTAPRTLLASVSGDPPSPPAASVRLGTALVEPDGTTWHAVLVGGVPTWVAATAGASVGTGHADVQLADPGHVHAGLATVTLTGTYTVGRIEAPGDTLGTLPSATASVVPTAQPGIPRLLSVAFPAVWPADGIVVHGVGRDGSVITETFAKPLALPGVVLGTRVFLSVASVVNTVPAPGGGSATLELGDGYGVPAWPVTFLSCCVDGTADPGAEFDNATGVFEPSLAHHGNHTVTVWYTYAATLATASATTGITASDAGHTHPLDS